MTNKYLEYNGRQFSLMLRKIQYYKDNKITLRNLSHDIEALINALDNIDPNFKEKLVAEWMELEIVFASSVFDGIENNLDQMSIKRISDTLDNLDELIKSWMQKNTYREINH